MAKSQDAKKTVKKEPLKTANCDRKLRLKTYLTGIFERISKTNFQYF